MQAAVYRQPSIHILYDADRIERPTQQWFSPDNWVTHGEVETFRQGRGGCWKVHSAIGEIVIKHYRRGGWVARLSYDKYVFAGWHRSRSFIEWRMLAELYQEKLPVPEPLAAICVKHGRVYRAGLLTRYIPGAQTLAQLLRSNPDQMALLAIKTGQLLAQFHAADVMHVDINPDNIVMDQNDRVWLLDFDRSRRVKMTARRCHRAFERLSRSINRLVERGELDAETMQSFMQQARVAYSDVGPL